MIVQLFIDGVITDITVDNDPYIKENRGKHNVISHIQRRYEFLLNTARDCIDVTRRVKLTALYNIRQMFLDFNEIHSNPLIFELTTRIDRCILNILRIYKECNYLMELSKIKEEIENLPLYVGKYLS